MRGSSGERPSLATQREVPNPNHSALQETNTSECRQPTFACPLPKGMFGGPAATPHTSATSLHDLGGEQDRTMTCVIDRGREFGLGPHPRDTDWPLGIEI